MSRRQVVDVFGDQEMMEEILELLAEGSDTSHTEGPTSSSGNSRSMSASTPTHSSSIRSSIGGTNHGDNGNEDTMFSADTRDYGDDEEKGPEQMQEQEQQQGIAAGAKLTDVARKRGDDGGLASLTENPPMIYPSGPFLDEEYPSYGVQGSSATAVATAPQRDQAVSHAPASIPSPPPQVPLPPLPPVGMAPTVQTGQLVRELNDAEFSDLRRKLQMQTASRRYRKRKKEETRRKKKQIQELQAELAELRELEAQHLEYQQRSVESLEEELETRTKEVEELSRLLEAAATEEMDRINAIKSKLGKSNK